MKMNRILYAFGLTLSTVLVSCRPEVNDPRNPPSVNSFTPGAAKTGDTVRISGSYLKGSKVTLNGEVVTLLEDSDGLLSFKVTDALTTGKGSVFTLSVEFKDGLKTTFSQKLPLNYIITSEDKGEEGWLKKWPQIAGETLKGPAQLLITDFDGHGVRTANLVTNANDFDKTQFSALVKTGGDQQITRNYRGIPLSPASGNCLNTTLDVKFIENGKNGYCGEFISRSELQNDRSTPWPKSFVDLPNSGLKYPINVANTYVNFYINKNKLPKGLLDIYLFNDDLLDDEQYRFRLPVSRGLDGWELISVRLNQFGANFGDLKPEYILKAEAFKSINKIKFNFTHDEKKDEDPCNCVKTFPGYIIDGRWKLNATGEVFIAIDHITITQGGPYIGYPSK
jgi:hypothetical protein